MAILFLSNPLLTLRIHPLLPRRGFKLTECHFLIGEDDDFLRRM